MHFTKLVTSVFYADILLRYYLSQPYCVLEKDGIGIMVFQDEQLAKEHNPELRLVTDNIEEVYAEVSKLYPHLLHPNLNKVTFRPWGAKEFAIADNQLGIRFQQW